MAARGGSLDCVRMLLAWGADRLQLDSSGYVNLNYSFEIHCRQCRSPLKGKDLKVQSSIISIKMLSS